MSYGYSNFTNNQIFNMKNRNAIFDELISKKNCVIAHRFGKLSHQPYSIASLEKLLNQNINLIEIDVNLTEDALANDQTFYISHGDMEEVAAADRNDPVLTSNFQNAVINVNNNLFSGCNLPSLKEFFDFAKFLPILILMEDKSGEPQRLFNYCQSIGLTSEYCVFQDFDDDALNIFKSGNYKTMKISNVDLTQSQIDNNDLYCCNEANISTFQANSEIDKFFYYTNTSGYEFDKYKSENSKLVGCFSDTPVATYKYNMKSDISLLNPYNGFVSVYNLDEPACKYTRYYQKQNGNCVLVINKKLTSLNLPTKTYVNCFNYELAQEEDHLFYVNKFDSTDGNDWCSIVFKCGLNYEELDTSETRLQAINILWRADERLQIYSLVDGAATQESSSDISGNNYKYFKVNIGADPNNNNAFLINVKGSITKDGSYTLIKEDTINYADMGSLSFTDEKALYLGFIRFQTWSGEIEYLYN